MRASHKTVDRLLSGFPDPGWGGVAMEGGRGHIKINIIITTFISIILIITIIIILLLLSQIRGRGGVAREGGRGHAGEDHIKINIIIRITSFIIITTMYSQIRGWGTLLGRFNRGNICKLKTEQKRPLYQIPLSVPLSWGKCFSWYTKDSGSFSNSYLCNAESACKVAIS